MTNGAGKVEQVAEPAAEHASQADWCRRGRSGGFQADVRASNGILHVVDHVLSPSDPAIAAAKVEAAQAATQPADAPAS